MTRSRAIVLAAVGLGLCALLLMFGVPVAAGWTEGHGAVVGELLFIIAVFGPMLGLAIALGRLGAVPALGLGTSPATRFVRGAAIGGGGLLLAITYCAIAGTLGHGGGSDVSAALLAGLVAVAIQVVGEEALFRGVIQPLAIRGLGRAAGVVIVAAAFAGLHALAGGAAGLELANMALGGLVFGVLALRDGGIAGAIGAHMAWNGLEQLGTGLDPNPGVGSFGSLLDLDLTGSALWGGSESGLNASVAATFALSAILAALLVRLSGWRGSEPRVVAPA